MPRQVYCQEASLSNTYNQEGLWWEFKVEMRTPRYTPRAREGAPGVERQRQPCPCPCGAALFFPVYPRPLMGVHQGSNRDSPRLLHSPSSSSRPAKPGNPPSIANKPLLSFKACDFGRYPHTTSKWHQNLPPLSSVENLPKPLQTGLQKDG